MLPPIPYKGKDSYIFISYSHKDADRVWPVVARLQADGYRVWYDEGIDPGTEWDENIAAHVNGCGYFLAFLSENYLESENCRDELNFARDLEKTQVLIYLEEVDLPAGIALRFGRLQNFRADRPGFFGRLYEAEGIKAFTTGKKVRSRRWVLPVILSAVAAIGAALLLPGLQREAPQPEPVPETQITEYASVEPVQEPFTLKKTTFLRNEFGIKITAQDFYFRETGELVLEVLVENPTDLDARMVFLDAYLNGIHCNSALFVEVPANTKEIQQMYWPVEYLKASGLDHIRDVKQITTIEGQYRVEYENMPSDPAYYLYYPYGESNAVEATYTSDDDDVILVDRDDYRMIATDRFLDESGAWVGEFAHINLSDRHMEATCCIEQTNGYVDQNVMVEGVRPGQVVYSRLRLENWQATQQDTVRRLDGWYWIRDTEAMEWISDQIPFSYFPEGDADITFPLRELEPDDKVLVENEYVRFALIDDYPFNSKNYLLRFYCVNLSEETIYVNIPTMTQNDRLRLDVLFCTLPPGQQSFVTELYHHEGKWNTLVVDGELTVQKDNSRGEEYSRDRFNLEFSW